MAEEAKGKKLEVEALLKIEVEAVKGRKDEPEEGIVGRKGERLDSDEELEEETAKEDAVVGPPVLSEEDRPDYEVRKHKTARRPLLPTKAEIDDHYPFNVTYRSWCKHCVAGTARSNQHVQSQEEKVRLGVT